jgi:hypothetical protein
MNKQVQSLADKLTNKTVRISYNYCGVCGRTPKTNLDEPNYAPVRWWDPDDGWNIGTLCRWCYDDYAHVQPKPEDYAFRATNQVCDDCNTDEDPIDAIGGAA